MMNKKRALPKFLPIIAGILITSCAEAQPKIAAEHIIVYNKEGRFAGWPANCAAAIFKDDNIISGFIEGPYELGDGHNLGDPYHVWLATSNDGGKTWSTRDPENYVGDFGEKPELEQLTEAIDFESPGFMMRVVGIGYHGSFDPRAHYFYSKDEGQSWKGPYAFGNVLDWPELKKYGLDELTPRTDYIVNSQDECTLFFSARKKDEFGTDRLFCIKTSDGGMSFNFMGWVIKPFEQSDTLNFPKVGLYSNPGKNPYSTECRAVMPSTVQLGDGTMLSAIRRKYIVKGGTDRHWIDLYASKDKGKTWGFRSMVSNTGPENGNPSALELTADNRLCIVYGDRKSGTINVRYSSDYGSSWEDPLILMDNFWSADMEFNDMGYPKLFRRSDGKMVAVFYYSTKENPHHLHASIWEP